MSQCHRKWLNRARYSSRVNATLHKQHVWCCFTSCPRINHALATKWQSQRHLTYKDDNDYYYLSFHSTIICSRKICQCHCNWCWSFWEGLRCLFLAFAGSLFSLHLAILLYLSLSHFCWLGRSFAMMHASLISHFMILYAENFISWTCIEICTDKHLSSALQRQIHEQVPDCLGSRRVSMATDRRIDRQIEA